MRVYIAGPMGGMPGLNFAAFDAAAGYLRALGHDVVNPAELDRDQGYDGSETVITAVMRQEALRRDFYELVTCDAIAFLPGWEASIGAKAERRVADDCGIAVYHVIPWVSFKPEVAPVIVAVSGAARAGKDTVGGMMGEIAQFERLAFADPLKTVALESNPRINTWYAETDHLADLVKRYGWEQVKDDYPDSRVFLQHLGGSVRDNVDPLAWVNAALRQINPGGRYVITDCRYRNEAEAIKAAGGYVVKVERPGYGPVNEHASENDLADWDFDAILRNNGTLDDLKARVRLFLSTL